MRTIRFGWLAALAAALLLALAACGKEAPPRAVSTPTSGRLGPTTAKQPGAATAVTAGQPGGDPRTLGDPNAPITIIEYSDYQ